jgi:hypothetical protein
MARSSIGIGAASEFCGEVTLAGSVITRSGTGIAACNGEQQTKKNSVRIVDRIAYSLMKTNSSNNFVYARTLRIASFSRPY